MKTAVVKKKSVYYPSLSKPMEGLVRHVICKFNAEELPAHTDDLADLLDDLDDKELSNICAAEMEGLRRRLTLELYGIEIDLPSDHCGWLVELLGEGVVDG